MFGCRTVMAVCIGSAIKFDRLVAPIYSSDEIHSENERASRVSKCTKHSMLKRHIQLKWKVKLHGAEAQTE